VNKKWKYFLIAVVLTVVAVIVLLPPVISSDSVRRLILSRVNEKIQGDLSIDFWMIGWNEGILFKKIIYTDPEQGIRFTAARATMTHGLLELAFAPKDLGLITVDSPRLEITPHPELTSESDNGQKDAVGPSRSTGKVNRKKSGSAPWEGASAELLVHDGQVQTAVNDSTLTNLAQRIETHAFLAKGIINFDLDFSANGDQGRVTAQGSLNLPARQDMLLETLVSKMDIKISSLQLKEPLALAASMGNLPTGQGLLNADLKLQATGMKDFAVQGDLNVDTLRMTGGFLGKDQPEINNVHLVIDCDRQSGQGWHIANLNLQADPGFLRARSESDGGGRKLHARAMLKLPVLFDLFPHLLKVREGVQMKSGTLDFEADLDRNDQRSTLSAWARADHLGGTFKGHDFGWNVPVSLRLNGEKKGRDLQIDRLELDAPFIRARGRGNLRSFSLEATSELQQAFAEVDKFFDVPWSGVGHLRIKATSSVEGDNRYQINTDLTVDNCAVFRSGQLVAPPHQFVLSGRVSAPPSFLREMKGPINAHLDISSWPGTIVLTTTGLQKKNGSLSMQYSLDTNLNLERVAGILQPLDFLSNKTTLEGGLQLQSSGFINGKTLAVRTLESRIDSFVLNQPGLNLYDQHIHLRIARPKGRDHLPVTVHDLAGQAVAEKNQPVAVHDLVVSDSRDDFFKTGGGGTAVVFHDRGLYLRNCRLDAESGHIDIENLTLQDWRRPFATLNSKIKIDADVRRLFAFFHDSGRLSADIDGAGSANLVFDAVSMEKKEKWINAVVHLKNFSLSRRKKIIYGDKNIRAAFQMQGRLVSGRVVDVGKINLHSSAFDLEASGSLDQDKGSGLFKAQGKLTPDLQRLVSIARHGFGVDLAMAGKKSEAFIVTCPLGKNAPDTRKTLKFSTNLYADHIGYMGVDIHHLEIPVYMENGILHAALAAQVNGGTLDLAPEWHLSDDPPVLTVPRASRALTAVRLRKPLVDGLLRRIHPLFGLLTTPSGQVDVRLNSLTWPLVPKGGNKAEFAAVIDLSRVNLVSSGFLRDVLTNFGLQDEKLKLRDSELKCVGTEGRITCSPLRILVLDSEMTLSGSVGMDQSLKYALQVPVTRKLVGKEGYRVLKGTTVRVPIRGTLSYPAFDRNLVAETVKGLVRQAAGRAIENKSETGLSDLLHSVLGTLPGK